MHYQHLYKRPPHRSLLQITITLTESALLIFLRSGVEKLLARAAGFEPTTLYYSSH